MDNTLKEVWAKYNLEDILNAGLSLNKISSSDIINASDIYKDPNKEYSDEEVQEIIKDRGLHDILTFIQNEYDLEDIIDDIGKNDVLDAIDEDDRFESIKYSFVLDDHDGDIREETKEECYEQIYEDVLNQLKVKDNHKKYLEDYSPDELRTYFCDMFSIGYYDDEGLNKGFSKLFQIMNKSTYNIKK